MRASVRAKLGFLSAEGDKANKQQELLALQKQYDNLTSTGDALFNQASQLRATRAAVYERMRKVSDE